MGASSAPGITVFWRPGCGFCAALLRRLDRMEVPHERRNIWEDPDAAAAVREAAGGNETVPTVRVGEEVLVNPSVHAILATVHRLDPGSDLPEPPEPTGAARLLSRLLGGGSER
jgi:mycoredoxin